MSRARKRLALLLSCALITTPATAQRAKTSTPAPASASARASAPLPYVDIPYERFVLPNGLTVIVNEDHRAPVVSIATYYHVGSSDETKGRTGFAHLFEHLMFNGSQNANDDWFKFMNEIGATEMNGSTGADRTNYYQTVPKGGLDRVLWYESDRMGNLLPAVDQARLDEQRKVVMNEKRQRANTPLGALPDLMYASTYPEGHPYSWTPIGSMEDLNAASLDDVKSFFKKWYGPNNAVVVLSGDITVAEAREKMQRFYGDIPAGPPLSRQSVDFAKMTGNRRATMQAAVAAPELVKIWNIPGWATRDNQLMRLAAAAMAGGENSPFVKHLVRELQLASKVDVQVQTLELGSQFTIDVTARPGVSADRLEAAIDKELADFLRDGPTQDTLDRIKFDRYASMARGQASTSGKAQALAEAQLYAGTPDFIRTRQTYVREATTGSILDSARKWLSDGQFVIEVVPFGKPTVSGKPVDRTAKPAITAPTPFKLPPLQEATLSNGIKVLLAERHDVPTVTVSALFDFGAVPDRNPASYDLVNAFGMTRYGTDKYDRLQLSMLQEKLAVGLNWTPQPEMVRFSMDGFKPKLDESLDLYADVLLHPTFPKDEWDRLLPLFKAGFEENKLSPGGKLALITGKMMYGPDHPYGAVSTPETMSKVSVDDLRSFYFKWVRPDSATFLVVGDTSLAEIMPKLEQRFGSWRATGPKPVMAPLPAPARPTRPRIILADQPGAESTLISVSELAPARADKDYDALDVVNSVLGGNFVSRLMLNLREDKGWTYGATSKLSEGALISTIGAGSAIQTDKTAPAMLEIAREIRELGTTRKPSPAEIAIAKNAMLLGIVGQLQRPSGQLELYRDELMYDLPSDYWNNYVQKVQALTTEQVQDAATRQFRPNELTWFVVGDLSKIEADIRKLNLGDVEVYDADGKRLR